MEKTIKISAFGIFFLLFFCFSKNINAETSNTFPVDEAGIAAYIKINETGPDKLAEILSFRKEIIEQKETHIIISFEIGIEIKAEISENDIEEKTYPLIYINTDGWMVAYYPKEKPASSIMQWTNYAPGTLSTTILEDALVEMTNNIEATYSTPIKYYHFAYPDANRMTLIAETVHHPDKNENSFSVIVPGTIYEASYFLYHSFRTSHTGDCYVKLFVDDQEIDSFAHSNCNGKGLKYGYYDIDTFKGNIAHLVSLSVLGRSDVHFQGGAATVFVYKVN